MSAAPPGAPQLLGPSHRRSAVGRLRRQIRHTAPDLRRDRCMSRPTPHESLPGFSRCRRHPAQSAALHPVGHTQQAGLGQCAGRDGSSSSLLSSPRARHHLPRPCSRARSYRPPARSRTPRRPRRRPCRGRRMRRDSEGRLGSQAQGRGRWQSCGLSARGVVLTSDSAHRSAQGRTPPLTRKDSCPRRGTSGSSSALFGTQLLGGEWRFESGSTCDVSGSLVSRRLGIAGGRLPAVGPARALTGRRGGRPLAHQSASRHLADDRSRPTGR